jgi:hypothetical protein
MDLVHRLIREEIAHAERLVVVLPMPPRLQPAVRRLLLLLREGHERHALLHALRERQRDAAERRLARQQRREMAFA